MAEWQGFGAAGAVPVTRSSPTDCWDLPGVSSPRRIATTLGRDETRSADN
jgi:hypothetical protein